MNKHSWKEFYDPALTWDGTLICKNCGFLSHRNFVHIEEGYKCKENKEIIFVIDNFKKNEVKGK